MKSAMTPLGAACFNLAAALALVCGACSHPSDRPVENQPPGVSITGGPLDGTTAGYTATVYWTGWDDDGVVANYEYAVDPPAVFTLEEIGHPERFAELTVTVTRGGSPGLDTLLVSKRVDGAVHSFTWIQTHAFSRVFAFPTPEADSLSQGSAKVPTDTFSGLHTVYLRARDDDGATSDAARLTYTATTIVPTSRILRPIVSAAVLSSGTTVTISWEGTDPDARGLHQRPVGFYYRLIDLDTLVPSPSVLHVQPSVLFAPAGRDSGWTYQERDSAQVTFHLNNRGRYIFGVRAVDEAGAVEPHLDLGRNAFRLQALSNAGLPKLVVTEATTGSFDFRGTAGVGEAEVPAGARLRFSWTANAEDYGGVIDGFSYGFDLPDLEREGPASGWSGWGMTTGIYPPKVFREPGVHTLYVRVRDESGVITIGTIVLKVLDFSMDREVLLIDDSSDRTVNPTDTLHDAFWASMFQESALLGDQPMHVHSTYGADDTFTFVPTPVMMSVMGRYRMLLWTINGSSSNGDTALLRATALTNHLAWYLRAGGMLWVTGAYVLPSTTPLLFVSQHINGANFIYPKAPAPGTFAYDFLKLRTGRIENDKGRLPENWLTAALPFPGGRSGYPLLEMDRVKVGTAKAGIFCVDAIFDPIYCRASEECAGVLDSLYAYKAVKTSSIYANKLIAARWHDPDPAREHGRVQWFAFPLYYMKQAQAQEVFDRSIAWFREEDRFAGTGAGAPPVRP